MTLKEDFINTGFSVIETGDIQHRCGRETQSIIEYLKTCYPQIIKDGEVNFDELKAVLGLPVDEKVNGYGLNFIGRNVAKAKYAQKTTKELKYLGKFDCNRNNGSDKHVLSSNQNNQTNPTIHSSDNMLLIGDNLDCLKILKPYYNGQIKCIYIDPPYNTTNDEFIYPDKFDKEEAEVLGLANISDNDFVRMEFSFRTKKSHNGWLSFMYPRLLLARDLLSKDGVIFISIDDNEQANLKLLCDEIFGEENFVGQIIWQTATDNNPTQIATEHEYVVCYVKNIDEQNFWEIPSEKGKIIQEKYDELKAKYNDANIIQTELRKWIRKQANGDDLSGVAHYSYVDEKGIFYPGNSANTKPGGYTYDIIHPVTKKVCAKPEYGYRFTFDTFTKADKRGDVLWGVDERIIPKIKKRLDTVTQKLKSYYYEDNRATTAELKALFDGVPVFNNPKSVNFLIHILKFVTCENDLILDFFAGSGTTGHAVMQLNAEDGGNRKFILCQIDEPINKDNPAYQFCLENHLPPVISSITIERLKRAGEKIRKEIVEKNAAAGLFEENKSIITDIGFRFYDTVDAPKLEIEEGVIVFQNTDNDPLSRIYNMIFAVGIDNPTSTPVCIIENCMYKIGNSYYLTNSSELDKEANKPFLSDAIKTGKVFIDGWTATINTTLQNYKENLKIVL